MRVNVEKRLLQLDLDMILDPYINRPGKQWWAGAAVLILATSGVGTADRRF